MKLLPLAIALSPLSVAFPALGALGRLARPLRPPAAWGGFAWAWLALALWGLLAAGLSGDFAAALGPWALGLVPALAFGAGYVSTRGPADYDALAMGVVAAGLAASAVALAVWGLGLYVHAEPWPGLAVSVGMPPEIHRANGIWGHPNHFAAYAVLALLAGLGLPERRGPGAAALGALAALVLLAGVVLSGSRGAWLGLVAGLALFALTAAPRLGAGLLGGLAAVAAMAEGAVRARLAGALVDPYRLAAWKSALAMIAERPFLGFGPGGWVRGYPAYRLPAETLNQPHPHDYFLQVAVEYGVPAALGLVALVGAALAVMHRRPGRASAALLAASAAVAVMSLADAPLAEGRMAIAYFALLGAGAALGQRPREEPSLAGP